MIVNKITAQNYKYNVWTYMYGCTSARMYMYVTHVHVYLYSEAN